MKPKRKLNPEGARNQKVASAESVVSDASGNQADIGGRMMQGEQRKCLILTGGDVAADDSQTEAKRHIIRAIENVAKRLGNTPSVCCKSYCLSGSDRNLPGRNLAGSITTTHRAGTK